MADQHRGPGEPVHAQVGEILELAERAAHSAPTGPHPAREGLDRELREIKADILRMGALVEDAIRSATDALASHDAEAANAVIAGDRAVNDMQRTVSSLIVATIATQQPVARDLRFLMALDHVTYELERMGDHAGSVAKQARKLAPRVPLPASPALPEMGEIAAQLVHGVLRALVDIDPVRARTVALRDDEIDEIYHRTFGEVLDLMRADPENVDSGARILFAAHYIERIGDRMTNIAEDVVFLASGEIEDLNP